MSYKVGQFTKGRLSADKYISPSYGASISSNGKDFILTEALNDSFNTAYCFTFTVNKRLTAGDATLVAYSERSAQQQKLRTIRIPRIDGAQYKIIFTPKFNGLKMIKFISAIDDITIRDCSIVKIKNLLTETSLFPKVLTKIDINGINGQMFAINGEEITLGRRNNFALSHKDLQITSFGFMPEVLENSEDARYEDFFTMVYEYKEETIE